MNYKRNDILAGYIARYKRGEIAKEQFLKQKRSLLQAEKVEKDVELQALHKTVSSLELQIKEIDQELIILENQE